MGTIIIEEYARAGDVGQPDMPVIQMDQTCILTRDATTSTTPENITLAATTNYITVYAVEAHRMSITADTTGTNYSYIAAGERRDFSVTGGQVLYYRSDA